MADDETANMADREQAMADAEPFVICGVGASAGGIEALEGFFAGMPDNPGIALVVVTHLNPSRESLLHEIIGRRTTMPVHVAASGMLVAPNNVYVLPEDAVLSIERGYLLIIRPDGSQRVRKPVDVFFSALARDCGEYAAGVVLSGGDGDGTLGVKAIKERGGLTLAQVKDGHGPEHPSMPDSAIATGYIDYAIPADAMGARLVEFAASLVAPGGPLAIFGDPKNDDTFEAARTEIYAILHKQVGHDFSGYKINTFLRRVQRRMQVTQTETVEAYVALLTREPAEVRALFRDLLINVTSFFRDTEAFEHLATLVIPQLFESRGAAETVRVWVPGCATGEEVYSIAILLREHMDTLTVVPRVQVFATDIDEHALSIARAARYPVALLDAVTDERRNRFFISDAGSFVLAKEARDLCIFSPHSVIRDPPFSRMDLVSCRNLLIYFGPDIQSQVVPTFHYALRGGGFLFLGTSENVTQFQDLFTQVDKKNRIFRKREDVAASVRLPLIVRNMQPSTQGANLVRRGFSAGTTLRQTVYSQVLDRFAPPHVVVNGEGDVVYFSSRTGKFLEPPAGLPNRQLLTMARKGLRLDLRTLFREAVETNRTVTRGGASVETEDGRVQILTLTMEPLIEYDEPLYLVMFTDDGRTLSREEASARTLFSREGASIQLEEELRETRERLQSLVEEYETALEELKSSNEELQSVNEEFQSTNEELEASKEELQSVNEELHTVNSELTSKVDALDRANGDLQNLFDSNNVATVFLDAKLVIRSYTPEITKLFNILPSDRGRPLSDLTGQIELADLAADVQAVMAGAVLIERKVETGRNEAHYLLRVTPYHDSQGHLDGAAVSFVDVTGLTRAEARLRVMVAELQHRTRNLLGVVQAIARQTIGKGGSLDAYKDRLSALGRVQGLISHATEETIDIGHVIRLELEAHGATDESKLTIEGPPTPLPLDYVQAIGLVVHELATNAVKHGALSSDAGRLDIRWRYAAAGGGGQTLVIDWRESGVQMPVDAGQREGFGRQLIEYSLEASLRARTELVFGADGVSCWIEIPLDDDIASGRPG
jgi:two-component system CheB/CheR fusion protein